MAIGVIRRQCAFDLGIVNQPIRPVVALTLFILHHANLVGQLFLRHSAQQAAHAITFQKQHPLKRAHGDSLEIIGPVKGCSAVKIRRAQGF